MGDRIYDAIVIGGGPGGSSASTYLSQAGHSVLLLEKEIFPRFHIGESLLPYNRAIFEELGVMPALESAGFPKKYGAQFYIGNGSKTLKFVFGNGRFTKMADAFQVERSRFDHILLKNAAEKGVEVREGWTVSKTENDSSGVTVFARDPSGAVHQFAGKFLVDASGRGNLTGNQQGLRKIHPNLKKLALFGHFRNVRRDEGSPGGDTVIIRLQNKWFWLIPISAEKISVGCVMDQKEFAEAKTTPAILFEEIWRGSPPLVERMANAELVGDFQVTSDFSYYNDRYVGDRLLRVGDAAGFMDPIFSAGVYLAMYSGKLAAQTISTALQEGNAGEAGLAEYEIRIRRGIEFYWRMVEHFYTRPFLDVFFNPRERLSLASAVNAALAGELEGGWRLRWRMELFFLIVKIQARFGIMPQVSFD